MSQAQSHLPLSHNHFPTHYSCTMTRTKKPGGRPPIADRNEARTLTIGVRVSPNEMANLQERAKHMGMSPSIWLRTAGLARRLPSAPVHVPPVNREQFIELARLASNLNQLAHAANEKKRGFWGGGVKVDSELLEQVRAELVRLRFALLGIKDPE